MAESLDDVLRDCTHLGASDLAINLIRRGARAMAKALDLRYRLGGS